MRLHILVRYFFNGLVMNQEEGNRNNQLRTEHRPRTMHNCNCIWKITKLNRETCNVASMRDAASPCHKCCPLAKSQTKWLVRHLLTRFIMNGERPRKTEKEMGFWIWILEWGFGNYIRLYFYYYYLFLIYIYDLWAWLETKMVFKVINA